MMGGNGNRRYRAIPQGGAKRVPAGVSSDNIRVVKGKAYLLRTDHSYFQSAVAGAPLYMRFSNGGSAATATDDPFSYEQPMEFVAEADTIFVFNQAAAARNVYLHEEYPDEPDVDD